MVRRDLFAILLFTVVLLTACAGGVAAQSNETATNEPIQHENPDSVSEEGDSGQVAEWMRGRLSEQLGQSTAELNQGEYEQAKSVIGDDYDSRMAQYVDIAGDISEDEQRMAETFRDTQERQRDFIDNVQQYREAERNYERARENGNESGARASARRMERLATDVNRTGSNAVQSYQQVSNASGVDTEAENRTIANVSQNVTASQETVRNATFIRTKLDIVEHTRVISFSDPMVLTGRLTAENGTAVANQSISIAVNDRVRTIRTDDRGQFETTYRPRTLQANASSVGVDYRPSDEAVYLGSNATAPVQVEQVDPTIRIRNAPETVAFGDQVPINVSVTVDGEPVSSVSLRTTLDGQPLGSNQTGPAGRVIVNGTMPASVDDGRQEVRVAFPLADRSIAGGTASTTLQVEPTATNLTADAERTGGNVTIAGQLATVTNRSIGNQSIVITRDGQPIGMTYTGPNGTYAMTIPADLPAGNGTVTMALGARFEGSETSFSPSSAETSVVLSLADPQVQRVGRVAIASLAAAALIVGGTVLWWRRRGEETQPVTTTETTDGTDVSDDEETTSVTLDHAEQFLDRGVPGAAVRTAYAVIRERYAEPRTHWELLQAIGPEKQDAAERVTTAYEHVAFSGDDVDETRARRTLDAAGRLVSDSTSVEDGAD